MLCHPDKIEDDRKEEMQAIFIELEKAYQEQDVDKVKQIYVMLESGGEIKALSDTIDDLDKLRDSIARFKEKLNEVQKEKEDLQNTEEYQTIKGIDDWSEYFKELYDKLVKERDSLNEEYIQLNSDP